MLDENLPTFVVSGGPSDRSRHDSIIHYTQHGSDLTPAYTLRKPDPASPTSKNRYALALYDAYYPDVLFAEILLVPEWTQPTLSAEQVRQHSGVPPPPEPILPLDFTIQLYNPDQQIVVHTKKSGTFNSAPMWEFELPMQTFRQPSGSTLDRIQSDPAALDLTPKIGFKWRRDGKLSKDLTCVFSGKTVNHEGKKKRSKEPDITVAIFRALKEVTLYEPNFQRIDIEDLKGFEVVLLMSAVAIRDIYFGQMRETFNISDPPSTSKAAAHPTSNQANASSAANIRPAATSSKPSRIPPTDPRSQWEIDAETARLKKQYEEEEQAKKRREAAEERQIKRMLEAEEREKRRQQAEIDKETERLKRLYGKEQAEAEARLRPNLPSRDQVHPNQQSRYSAPHLPTSSSLSPLPYQDPYTRPNSTPHHYQPPPAPAQPSYPSSSFAPNPGSYQPYAGGPYLQPAAASQSTFLNHHGPLPPRPSSAAYNPKLKEKKSSFFGLGRSRGLDGSGDDPGFAFGGYPGSGPPAARLAKKKSSIF